jgi:hypothetical protein
VSTEDQLSLTERRLRVAGRPLRNEDDAPRGAGVRMTWRLIVIWKALARKRWRRRGIRWKVWQISERVSSGSPFEGLPAFRLAARAADASTQGWPRSTEDGCQPYEELISPVAHFRPGRRAVSTDATEPAASEGVNGEDV